MIRVHIYNVMGDPVKEFLFLFLFFLKKGGGEVRGWMDGWMDGVYKAGKGEYELKWASGKVGVI